MMAEPQGYYAASAGAVERRGPLIGGRRADICIVGGGYTGLSAALHAARAGGRVELLEQQTIGFGASGRNGGQIHTGLRKDQADLEKWLGETHARDLWRLSEEAKSLVTSLVETHRIDCELKHGLVIAAHNEAAVSALARDTEHLDRVYEYRQLQMMDKQESEKRLGTNIYPAARFDTGGGHLHPLLFARGLADAAEASGAVIHEDSAMLSFEDERSHVRVRTQSGSVVADRLVLACDAFTGTVAPRLDKFIGHVESFVTATAPLPLSLAERVIPCDAAVADTRHVLDYYRKSIDNRLIFAGREAYLGMPSDIASLVRPRMLEVFPELSSVPTEYAWSGTVGITVTRMPHFGRLSERTLFAHGYSGQGVALATLGGKLLAEAAMGHAERFDVLASVPARPFPGGRLLRKPLIAAALATYKILDAL
jgi:gamma-glutamylputrescine oxidase